MVSDTRRGAGLDCGDSGCKYATERGGMRTNSGCRCDLCPGCEKNIRFGHRTWCQFEAQARRVLAAQGLHVVTAADKAVLDAMARIPRGYIESWIRASVAPTCQAALRAELARRGLK